MPRRSIDTSVWGDPRFATLSPEAMLIFVRVIAGDDTTPAGATRATAGRFAADCNLTPGRKPLTAEEALAELVASGLLRAYDEGWHWLPAFIRYQLSGPDFIGAIRRTARGMPEALAKAISRALEEKVGERKAHPDDAPRPDKGRTRKGPNSRGEGGRTGGSDRGVGPVSREGSETETETETGSGLTFGQSVLTPVDDAPASPSPAPGAPAPAGADVEEGEPQTPASTAEADGSSRQGSAGLPVTTPVVTPTPASPTPVVEVSAVVSRNEELDERGVSRANQRALDSYATTREVGFIRHLLDDSPYESDAAKRAARALLEKLPPPGGERGG